MPRYNEAALAYVFNDVTYIQTEIGRLDRPGLDHVFDEVKLVSEASGTFRSPSSTYASNAIRERQLLPRSEASMVGLARRKRVPKRPMLVRLGHGVQASSALNL